MGDVLYYMYTRHDICIMLYNSGAFEWCVIRVRESDLILKLFRNENWVICLIHNNVNSIMGYFWNTLVKWYVVQSIIIVGVIKSLERGGLH